MQKITSQSIGKYSISIVHSPRARHLRISISPDKQVSLIIPHRSSEREGIKFLNSRVDWIEKTIARIKPRKRGKWEYKFLESKTIFFFGLPHRLQFNNNHTYPNIHTNKNIINNFRPVSRQGGSLTADHRLIVTPQKKKVFENFLSNKLREHIYSFAYKFCHENGFAFRELKIKNIVSRWGSCSRQGNLNFSTRLVHYDREVINYVVIHELCHTKEMNHSRKFWALVAKYCPEYKSYIKMLK